MSSRSLQAPCRRSSLSWVRGARGPEHTRSLTTAIDAAEGCSIGAGVSNCRPPAASYNQRQGGGAMPADVVERKLRTIGAADIARYRHSFGALILTGVVGV